MSEGSHYVGVVPVDLLRDVSGIEFFDGIIAGKYPRPPISDVLNFELVSVETGLVRFRGEPSANYYNTMGTVHGGWAATLLDSCMACAVHSMLEAGKGCTTLEFKLNFVRPITVETGTIFAEGKIISAGRNISTAEGRLMDTDGKIYAHATITCMIFGI